VTTAEVARFWSKVDKSGDCWLWTGTRSVGGYGRYAVKGVKNHLAHRYAYEHTIGQIPAGLVIDHLCRNAGCVNPSHLEPVTAWTNNHRSTAPSIVKAHAARCSKGHVFDDANTRWEVRESGQRRRICRTCQGIYRKARYAATAS